MPKVLVNRQIPFISKELFELEEIPKLTLEQLQDPKTQDRLLLTAKDPLYSTESFKAMVFANEMKTLLKRYSQLEDSSPVSFKRYKDIIKYLEYISLVSQPEEIAIRLLKEDLVFAYDWEVDIVSQLSNLFLSFNYDVTGWERTRSVLLNALRGNEELIGKDKIEVDEEELDGNTRNWLLDYDRSSEAGKERSELERVTYINKSKNTKDLSEEGREILTMILQIYDHLKFNLIWVNAARSANLISQRQIDVAMGEKVTEATPKVSGVSVGPVAPGRPTPGPVFEKPLAEIPKKEEEKPSLSQEEIAKLYEGDIEENKIIDQAEKDLAQATGQDYLKLRDVLDRLISPTLSEHLDKVKIIAALKLLAKIGKLDDLLKDDKRFSVILLNRFKAKKQAEALQGFNITPKAPQFLSIFLQIILKEKLKMNETDSARIGLQLANLLKQYEGDKYNKLAYFDINEGGFKWGI